eukprot:gene46042-61564_t
MSPSGGTSGSGVRQPCGGRFSVRIRTIVIAASCALVLVATLSMGASLTVKGKLEAANAESVTMLSAMRNHMTADMLHDGLRGVIDLALDSRLKTAPPQQVRTLLRIALAQRWVLDVPAFAAVSSAVKLAEREAKTRPYKALVNAVLRGLERDPAPAAPPQANLPDWIAARWTQSWGPET